MKSVFKKIRFPRKVMFVIAGAVVLCGASGAYALYSAKDAFLGAGEPEAPSLSGLACTTIETLKMRRNGQRWIRKYVRTESAAGVERVRTALRVAGLLVKEEKADLYQVVVLDQAGPTDRADRRGPAIGAEVLFAPDPTKLPGMKTPFVARYNDGAANTVGLFYGNEIDLTEDDVKATLTAMDDKAPCAEPVVAGGEHGEEGSQAGAHGEKPASGHGGSNGDAAEADHEAEPSEHGDEPAEAAHGEGAPAEAHGEDAPAEHGEAKAEEKGFFGSLIAMVLGGDEKPAAHAEPAENGHGADASVLPALDGAPSGHDAGAGTHDKDAATAAHGEEAKADHPEPAKSGHGADPVVLPMPDAASQDGPATSDHEKPSAEAGSHQTGAEAH